MWFLKISTSRLFTILDFYFVVMNMVACLTVNVPQIVPENDKGLLIAYNFILLIYLESLVH